MQYDLSIVYINKINNALITTDKNICNFVEFILKSIFNAVSVLFYLRDICSKCTLKKKIF